MVGLQNSSTIFSDEEWQYAIFLGLVSVPFTIILYWQSLPDFTHHVSPVFFIGLLSGFISNRRGMKVRRIGVRTGLIAALPVLWPFFDLISFISGLAQPIWFSLIQVNLLIIFSAFVIGLSALVGMTGAIVGNWLTTKVQKEKTAFAKAVVAFLVIVFVLTSFRLLIGDPPGHETTFSETLSTAVGWGGLCAVSIYVISKRK